MRLLNIICIVAGKSIIIIRNLIIIKQDTNNNNPKITLKNKVVSIL
ncbi:hypothetical protein H377_5620 [Rickettsia prowazekii str. Cairo 3]|nr:hypothetical protein H374_5950 [Rickettsia prowazekii str. NMRC Madrid E]EOB10588.1 hypothetical protein H377_5620 [Rickettsia prowazekii str. Cairo 3]